MLCRNIWACYGVFIYESIITNKIINPTCSGPDATPVTIRRCAKMQVFETIARLVDTTAANDAVRVVRSYFGVLFEKLPGTGEHPPYVAPSESGMMVFQVLVRQNTGTFAREGGGDI